MTDIPRHKQADSSRPGSPGDQVIVYARTDLSRSSEVTDCFEALRR